MVVSALPLPRTVDASRRADVIRGRLNLSPLDQESAASPPASIQHSTIPLLFTLPSEIFSLILKRLVFRDIVALSLTSKALRDIYSPPLDPKRRRCAQKIHSVFLPHVTPNKNHSKQGRLGQSLSGSSGHKCPYCAHPLCPPTCSSALLLDSNTGIFFPASLWPDCARARFLYAQKPLPPKQHAYYRVPPSIGAEYSTIWCDHHRCPRGLFSIKSIYRRSGPMNFLAEYRTRLGWQLARKSRGQAPKLARWFVGYKAKSREEAASIARVPEKASRAGCYEKVFYETFCRHCLRPIEHIGVKLNPRPLGDKSCGSCGNGAPWLRWNQGCLDCGVVSVRISMIDVFDEAWSGSKLFFKSKKRDGSSRYSSDSSWQEHDGYWLFLATECRIVSTLGAVERRRLVPVDPKAAAAALHLVRGRPVHNIAKPKVGIEDLPYKVLSQILGYLKEDWEDSSWYSALTASYCFLKASQRMHPLVGRPYTAEEVWRNAYILHSIW